MSRLIILFVAIAAAIGPLSTIKTASAQALDINKILELVQQTRLNSGTSEQRRLQLRQDSSDTDSDADSDSDDLTESDETDGLDNNRFGRSNKERLIDLLETLANEKIYKFRSNDRPYRNLKPKYSQSTYVSRIEKHDNSQDDNNIQTHVLEKLFSNNLNGEKSKTKPTGDYPKKRLKPNRLLPDLNKVYDNDKNNDVTGLQDYSKVYVVLNPKAVRKSKNKNALNDLISKLLSLSGSTSKKSRQVNRKPRYRGFVVNDHVLRRSRLSKEIYAPRDDSMGDDYKPKKSRNAGNPLAGHTAIPYIRHRGDIYERDN